VDRAVVDTSLGLKPWTLSRGIEGLARFDAQGFTGGRTFGWFRGQVGVTLRPVSRLSLSTAYISARQEGTPDMLQDRLVLNGGMSYRADLRLGSLQASYLQRYTLRGQFFDDEYEIAQAVGTLRASVLYRRFPSDFRLGLTFRLDDFINAVKRHHGHPEVDQQPTAIFQ
jgi:hypothetical protein